MHGLVSLSSSSVAICLEDEAHGGERSELHGIDDGFAAGDLERAVAGPQLVAVMPDEIAYALVAAEAMHRGTDKKETTLQTIRKVFKGMKLNKPYPIKEVTLELRKQGGLAHQSMPFRRSLREAMEYGGIEVTWNNGVMLTRIG